MDAVWTILSIVTIVALVVLTVAVAAVALDSRGILPRRRSDGDDGAEIIAHRPAVLAGELEGFASIGPLVMEFMDELRNYVPDGSEVVALGIAAEVRSPCEDGDHTHTLVVPASTCGSEVHERALFYEAAGSTGDTWAYVAEDDDDE